MNAIPRTRRNAGRWAALAAVVLAACWAWGCEEKKNEDAGTDADADVNGDVVPDVAGEDGTVPDVPACVVNGVCDPGETCENCHEDCGECPTCGDGTCDEARESCVDCETDCGPCGDVCGDGTCGSTETTETCAVDCPDGDCGDGTCAAGVESCASCLADCGPCVPVCGDGFHDPTEECDDGNLADGDGCDGDCTYTCHADGDCDDGNPCNRDVCDPTTHLCAVLPDPDTNGVTCAEGDCCTGTWSCDDGVCVSSTGLDCDDRYACTTDRCDDTTCECVNELLPTGTPCDDGVFCTGNDRCYGVPACMGVWGVVCDDHDACTTDVCNEEAGTCTHSPPSYRAIECGRGGGGNLAMGTSEFGGYTCPGGSFTAATNDQAMEVVVTGAGTLTITGDSARSDPAAQFFLVRTPCDLTTCVGRGTVTTPLSVSVTPGTYYLIAESPGEWAVGVACP